MSTPTANNPPRYEHLYHSHPDTRTRLVAYGDSRDPDTFLGAYDGRSIDAFARILAHRWSHQLPATIEVHSVDRDGEQSFFQFVTLLGEG